MEPVDKVDKVIVFQAFCNRLLYHSFYVEVSICAEKC